MKEPEILAIAKLELKPGDTLLVWVPKDCPAWKQANITHEFHSMHYDPSIKLAIVSDDMGLSVIRGTKP